MSDILDFWKSIPIVTKSFLVPSVIVPFVLRFKSDLVYYAFYDVKRVFGHGELYRLIVPFFVRQLGFSFIMDMFFLYRHMKQLEEEEYRGKKADFVWMIILLMTAVLIICGFGKQPFLSQALMMSILYVWSRKFPDVNMTFMFGIRFKSKYLVWVLTIYHLILAGSVFQEVTGIICGHVYWFCSDVLPRTHGIELVKAPILLRRLIPDTGVAGVQYMDGQFEARPPRMGQQQQQQQDQNLHRRHNWGAGQVLGEQ